jgi:hypothetical protein
MDSPLKAGERRRRLQEGVADIEKLLHYHCALVDVEHHMMISVIDIMDTHLLPQEITTSGTSELRRG